MVRDVPHYRCAKEIEQCISAISAAEFVAIDFEYSGLFDKDTPKGVARRQSAYFRDVLRSVPQFSVLQVGICVAQRPCPRTQAWNWQLQPYSFYVLPSGRALFLGDTECLKFLRRHNFDFNAWLETRATYDDLMPVIDAIVQARVPLIMHHAILDCCHLLDKLVRSATKPPAEWLEFLSAWNAKFEHVDLFDTR